MKEVVFFLLVPLYAKFVQSGNCYWRGSSSCGRGERYGSDIFIRNEFTKACIIKPDVYCCPRGDGNDLMLCEHSKYRGHCISHSVEERKCVNVDKTYWASSVDPLGNCFRLYNGRDCSGKSIAVYPGLDGTDNLTQLRFDDQIVSVSHCLQADREGDYGSQLKKSINRQRRSNNLPTPYYRLGVNDRTESMVVSLKTRHLGTGTATNQRSRQYARNMGRPTDDAGHILAQRLGGSGTNTHNIFPQSPHINRGIFSRVEGFVSDYVRRHGTAKFAVNLIYEDGATRPLGLRFILIDKYNRVVMDNSLPNP